MARSTNISLIAISFFIFNIIALCQEKQAVSEMQHPVFRSIICFFDLERLPSPVNLSEISKTITFPIGAINENTQGTSTIKVLVDKTGAVIDVGRYSGETIFENEVKEKARDLVFTPAIMNGKPIRYWMTVPFRFKLK